MTEASSGFDEAGGGGGEIAPSPPVKVPFGGSLFGKK